MTAAQAPSREVLEREARRLLIAHALEDGDATVLAGVLGRARIVHLATGEALFREGDPGGEIVFLLEGRVRVTKADQAGRERDLGSWFSPAILGAVSLLSSGGGPGRRIATCIAGAPTTAGILDVESTRALLADPGPEGATLRWILLSAFTEALASATERLRELVGGPRQGDLAAVQAALHGIKGD
jgi:CRP-like cAMP-binding protein